jgi:hypothetical protein
MKEVIYIYRTTFSMLSILFYPEDEDSSSSEVLVTI